MGGVSEQPYGSSARCVSMEFRLISVAAGVANNMKHQPRPLDISQGLLKKLDFIRG